MTNPWIDPNQQQPPSNPIQQFEEPEQAAKPKQRRRWPWIVGIVAAFFVGIGIGAAPEDPELLAQDSPAVQDKLAELGERESELDSRAQALDTREGELTDREGDLNSREGDLNSREGELSEREGELEDQGAELDQRADDVAAAEQEAVEAEAVEQEAAGTIPGGGTFIVGEDIEPGTYRGNANGNFCYWERLSGTSGALSDVIANGLPDGQAVVTIEESDVAFSSQDCGEWTLQ